MASSTSRGGWLNATSFWSILLCALAIVLSWLFGILNFNGAVVVARACNYVAQVLAYFVVGCYSFIYAQSKSKTAKNGIVYLILWFIAIILVVVFMIMGML